MQMPTGREPILKFERQVSPCQPVARAAAPGRNRSLTETGGLLCKSAQTGPGAPPRLTLGVSFLERIAGIHKAGGRIVFALELQVQLGCLAERASGSWNRKERAQP